MSTRRVLTVTLAASALVMAAAVGLSQPVHGQSAPSSRSLAAAASTIITWEYDQLQPAIAHNRQTIAARLLATEQMRRRRRHLQPRMISRRVRPPARTRKRIRAWNVHPPIAPQFVRPIRRNQRQPLRPRQMPRERNPVPLAPPCNLPDVIRRNQPMLCR